MKSKAFKPFPIGTVRGPYSCGRGDAITGYNTGVQFLVNGENGWIPFIEASHEEAKCRKKAESCAAEILDSLKRRGAMTKRYLDYKKGKLPWQAKKK